MATVVLYHGDWDGVVSAWICGLAHALHRSEEPPIKFHEARYGVAPPHVEADDDVWIVDFCYGALDTLHLLAAARTVRVIDHHQTAIETLEESGLRDALTQCVLQLDKSGCGLVWRTRFGDAPPPALVRYVEDHDLWRFALPDSREIRRWIHSYAPTLGNAALLHSAAPDLKPDALFPASVVWEGRAIDRALGTIVDSIASRATLEEIGGAVVPTANSSALTSDVGAELLRRCPSAPFACVWSDEPKGRLHGLRSREDGIDVSEVARRYGGGGHAHAAGFTMPRGRSPWSGEAE